MGGCQHGTDLLTDKEWIADAQNSCIQKSLHECCSSNVLQGTESNSDDDDMMMMKTLMMMMMMMIMMMIVNIIMISSMKMMTCQLSDNVLFYDI